MQRTDSIPLVALKNPNSHVSEAYRTLKTNIQYALPDRRVQILLVTSPAEGEGKSMTVANLGAAYAGHAQRVLLIDANFRSPALHTAFHKTNGLGLSDVLAGKADADAAIVQTDLPGLYVLPAGPQPASTGALLESPELERLLDEARSRFNIIIVDAPGVLSSHDAKLLATRSDGVLLVVGAGKTQAQQVRKARSGLEWVGARMVGAVINNKKDAN